MASPQAALAEPMTRSRQNLTLAAATVLLVMGCAVLALLASRALSRPYAAPTGRSVPAMSPLIVYIDH